MKSKTGHKSVTTVDTNARSRPVESGSASAAIASATKHLLGLQHEKGYWVGELEADASVTAGYVPLMYFMTGEIDSDRQKRAINFVLSKQNPDGSWPSYQGGPGQLDVSVQCYFALKLAGRSSEEPYMNQAKEFILASGGLSKINTLTKIWLALFGQYDWRGTPAIPLELMMLPDWFPFSIYDFASWSRETIVALMVVLEQKPTCPIPESATLHELYVSGEKRRSFSEADRLIGWEGFFLAFDRFAKMLRKSPVQPGHKAALRKAEKWIVAHQEQDGSWGGIMLPWVYSLVALKSLGYKLTDPVIEKGMKGLEGFIVEENETMRLQPATSPVWDTAWSMIALKAAGLPGDAPSLIRGGKWLLDEEVCSVGDWQVKNKHVKPGGWAFEFDNDIYPDIDDTGVVPRALYGVSLGDESAHCADAIERGLKWAISMQCGNGGWAAFDKDNNKRFLEHVPFADFMTPLDPTSPDVTAHMLELLAETGGFDWEIQRAVDYLKREQQFDGAWYGRWGVNYIYGTGLTLAGLKAVGENIEQEYIQRAATWLVQHQNRDGGWGETCGTYDDSRLRGEGQSTASQTAWALIGLIAAGRSSGGAASRGVDYLIHTQADDGSWPEEPYTGTGFPRAFYLRYDLYRIYFPLLALAKYEQGGK